MKKKININDIKIGMFVDLSGAKLKHDFFSDQFIISSKKQIAKLKAFNFKEVLIDTEKKVNSLKDVDVISHHNIAEKGRNIPAPEKKWEPEKQISIEFREAIKDKKKSSEEKARIIYQSSIEIMTTLFENPSVENIITTKMGICEIVDVILSEDATANHLLHLTNHDFYTYTHSVNVGVLAVMLAKVLYRKSDAHDMHELGAGFFLHDIGKTKVDTDVINKPGKLTDKEMAHMRIHPFQGYKILENADQLSEECKIIVMQHHEREDGTGYPKRIKGGNIHAYGKIGCIADVYDALTAERSYKPAMRPYDALDLMKNQMIQHFDYEIFSNFVRLFA